MKKNRILAIALAILLGGFGVHKFYLRNVGAGIFYIILNILTLRLIGFGVASVLGWIDAFRMMTMGQRDFDRKYNWDHMRKSYSDVSRHRPSSRRHKEIERRKRRQRKRKRVRHNPYKKEGLRYFKDYDLDKAIESFEKALEISPRDPGLNFNMACAMSLTEQTERAFHHLSAAVENGLKNKEMIHGHDALAFVRIQPEFEKFVENGYKYVVDKEIKKEDTAEKKKEEQEERLPQLEKLKELREKGLITELEFIKEKQKLKN
ncbi:MAG: NINE protein [Saprospiraceae bacterium]|nr:NINE protein [Saprospiraceae bacterium]